MSKSSLKISVLMCAVMTLTAHAVAQPLQGPSLTGFALKTCTADGSKCLIAESPSADGSRFKPLYVMKDVQVTLHDRKAETKSVFRGQTGYFDMNMDQLVLVQESTSGTTEQIFELRTMELTENKMN